MLPVRQNRRDGPRHALHEGLLAHGAIVQITEWTTRRYAGIHVDEEFHGAAHALVHQLLHGADEVRRFLQGSFFFLLKLNNSVRQTQQAAVLIEMGRRLFCWP